MACNGNTRCNPCATGNPCGGSYGGFQPSTALARQNAAIDLEKDPKLNKALETFLIYESLLQGRQPGTEFKPDTKSALQLWQSNQGLLASGNLDSWTVASFASLDCNSNAAGGFGYNEGCKPLQFVLASTTGKVKDEADHVSFYKRSWFIPTMVAGAAILVIGVVVLRTK